MYTIAAAQAPGGAGEDLWAAVEAMRLLEEAVEQVGLAGVGVSQLIEDACWENAGVRALRWALSDLSAQLESECGELRFQRQQVARAL
jgi:translation initiation factor 2 alpha subunit (eIF-2alpha)